MPWPIVILLFYLPLSSFGQDKKYNQHFFYDNFPNVESPDELQTLTPVEPYNWKTWYKNFFGKDEKGILLRIQNQLIEWREKEEYVKYWNLGSTDLINLPTSREKKQFIFSHLLKYGDAKLARAAREADEDSNIVQIAKAREALRPDVSVNISKNVEFKFNARLLEGLATLKVINPYFENETVIDRYGNFSFFATRYFETFKTRSSFAYSISENSWTFKLDKNLFYNITGSLISSQDDKTMAFSDDANKIIQFHYHYFY